MCPACVASVVLYAASSTSGSAAFVFSSFTEATNKQKPGETKMKLKEGEKKKKRNESPPESCRSRSGRLRASKCS